MQVKGQRLTGWPWHLNGIWRPYWMVVQLKRKFSCGISSNIANYLKYNYFCYSDGINNVMLWLWTFSDFCSRHILGVAGDDIRIHILVVCVVVCLNLPRCLSGRFNYEGQVPHKQYFAGTLLGMSGCASYVSRTHDVIADVTRSQSRSNFEIDISPSIFQLERRSKLKMSKMLMAIFLVYSISGITSGKIVCRELKMGAILKIMKYQTQLQFDIIYEKNVPNYTNKSIFMMTTSSMTSQGGLKFGPLYSFINEKKTFFMITKTEQRYHHYTSCA